MPKSQFFAFISAASLFLGATAAQAQSHWRIEEHSSYGPMLSVAVEGEITRADVQTLLKAIEYGSDVQTRLLVLSSVGGDLRAAIEMGRMIRRHDFDAVILPDHRCLSACVFLLAAAVYKNVQGSVGIHRPYFTSGTPDEIGREIKALKAEAVSYLEEMNLPARLAEDMFSVDPGKVRMLTDRELEDYRLSSKDFVEQESDTLRMMGDLNMSREAFEAFRADLNYSCSVFMGRSARMQECVQEIAQKHGIPLGGSR